MEIINLIGKIRNKKGKYYSNYIRKKNKIPCVLYGVKNKNIIFYLSIKEIHKIIINFKKKNFFINIELIDSIDSKNILKKNFDVIIKEIQYHPVSDKIIHIDFYEIDYKKNIILDIPIKIIGKSIGVIKGGKINFTIKKLRIESIPKKMPKSIKIDISNLDIGDSFLVKDIIYNKKEYKILHPYNLAILSVTLYKKQEEKLKEEENLDKSTS
ncbi:50S ribosomal protein L25 [Candidatus Shikimatogenerans silvanidophilus]|uniref:50S ribosomal protein L25 n=1 Tax=Candidatus Shikimatogenerans silvanidophilus TaxID=2782547 RepID=UPI001BA8BDAD|nr:50S ribosomal protein L25 [Candidatus Shikimatogenerans silvanidophilus]